MSTHSANINVGNLHTSEEADVRLNTGYSSNMETSSKAAAQMSRILEIPKQVLTWHPTRLWWTHRPSLSNSSNHKVRDCNAHWWSPLSLHPRESPHNHGLIMEAKQCSMQGMSPHHGRIKMMKLEGAQKKCRAFPYPDQLLAFQDRAWKATLLC